MDKEIRELEVTDYSEFIELCRNFIFQGKVVVDVLDDICLFDYANIKFEELRESDLLQSVRGLIIDTANNKMLNKSILRFKAIDELIPNIDKIVGIYEKIDGCLCFSYNYKGEVCWTVRRFLRSEIAERVDSIIREKYQELRNYILENEIVLFCEYVGELSKIVVPYKKEEVVLLAAYDLNQDKKLNRKNLEEISQKYNIKLVKQFDVTIYDVLDSLDSLTTQLEGYIIEFEDGEYMKLSSRFYNLLYDLLEYPSYKRFSYCWAKMKLIGRLGEFYSFISSERNIEHLFNELGDIYQSNFFVTSTVNKFLESHNTEELLFERLSEGL